MSRWCRGAACRHKTPFQQWCEQWAAECLRVLKPGGFIAAFGGTRTFHRLACAIEDAGFEIRDSIGYGHVERPGLLAWEYGSGFPKSLNVTKALEAAGVADPPQGLGTALKPAWEPIVLARKPLAGTVAATVQEWGTGALNIDATRIAANGERFGGGAKGSSGFVDGYDKGAGFVTSTAGRWPTNVVMDGDTADELDAEVGTLTSGKLEAHHVRNPKDVGILGAYGSAEGERGYGDSGGPSRFFPVFRYQAKAPTRERPKGDVSHPTVKPLALMRWLVRLVTPPGGVVLEPFAGSGTTVEAAILEGFQCIAIEREADYLPLILQRIERNRITEEGVPAVEALTLWDDEESA